MTGGRHEKAGGFSTPWIGLIACLGIGILVAIAALAGVLTESLVDTLMTILRLLLASNN